jgi:hypothetical protein
MKYNLYDSAKRYVDILEKMEKTSDPKQLQMFEEKRVRYHWEFLEALKSQGLKYRDREHATQIAIRIVHGEL